MNLRLIFLALLFVTSVAFSSTSAFVTIDPTPEKYAWWLRARYHPFATNIRGIPISRFDPTWCKANEFAKSLFPPELLTQGGTDVLKTAGLAFSITDTFGPRSKKLSALVGAYERCDGGHGLFLLILEKQKIGNKAVFLDQFPDKKGLPSLRKVSQNALQLWWCLECDNSQVLEWNRKNERFEWKPIVDTHE